jgi:hypothetical protein
LFSKRRASWSPAPSPILRRSGPLDPLNDWACAADSHPIILFEAIGGVGKSMLAWEWVNIHAGGVRGPWADGEPYVHRYELNKARALLEALEVEIPDLQPYDPAKDEKLPWEDQVVAAIEKLKAENEAKKAAEKSESESGEH